MGKVSKRLLLGILGAATSFGMIVGGKAIVDSVDNRATEVAAAGVPEGYSVLTSLEGVSSSDKFVLGTVYKNTFYAYSEGTSSWGKCSTSESDWQIWTIQAIDVDAGTFYAFFGSNQYLNTPNEKWSIGTKSTLSLRASDGAIQNSGKSKSIFYNYSSGNGGFRWYSSLDVGTLASFYKVPSDVAPESVSIISESTVTFDEEELLLEASVLPADADQSVTWSIEPENDSCIIDDGLFYGENKTTEDIVVTVVAASTVDPSIKDEIQITVKPKIMTGIEVLQMPTKTEYTVGSEFDPSGIAIQAVYKDGVKPTDVTDQIEYSYGTFTELGEVEVIATLKGTEFTAPIKVNVVERAVTEIAISGQKTSFNVEDSFAIGDGAEIIVSWNDGEIEEVAIDNADLSFELVNSESAEIGSGTPLDSSYKVTLADNDKYVLVSYKGIAACYQISVKEPFVVTNGQFVKVSSADELAVGDRIVIAYKNNMMANYESGEYIASYAFEHGDNFALEPSDLENIGVIELGKPLASSSDDSSFSFKQISGDAEQYLYCNGEKKISSTSDISGLGSKAYWQITKDNDCFAVTSKITGNYNLQYNDNSPRFTCYKGTMKNVDIFKFVTYTEEATNGWASEMMGSGICDTGVADSETWSLLELYYDDLSVGAQQLLQSYEADVSESASVLAQALYRYDYILDIYGTDRFNDYIRRGGTPSGAYGINPNGNDNLWAIAGLSLSAVISSAALLILRKKKQA